MLIQFLGTTVVVPSLSTEALRKLKREHGTVQSGGKNFKRDYSKEKLRKKLGTE
jgi:hypothetical protein